MSGSLWLQDEFGIDSDPLNCAGGGQGGMWAWGMLFVARGAASMTLETDLTCASATGEDAVCFEWLKTCRNKVGIASILFISFICASEQRTLQLEVASSSGMLSTQSLTTVKSRYV